MKLKSIVFLLISILPFFLLACTSKADEHKISRIDNAGKNLNKKIAGKEKPVLRYNPCLQSPEEWGEPADQAFPEEGKFWAADAPRKLERMAFGTLTHNSLTNINVSIKNFEVDTLLPSIPEELPVYIQGSYPSRHKELFKSFTPYHESLEYHPAYSGIYFAGINPLTEKADELQQNYIEQKAKEVLGKLITPGSIIPKTIQHENGGWTVIFYRHINDTRCM
ncbi:hypothetical protein CU633_05835 [Bacillus sp. V3-13]|uniref:hypothetical protein n=1 Tax=Bacillus sp. V3-13 TaxID=2053728 RepID=UPI000C77C047|nr:hypothetical protein [Bacillus sp. V3-13]PLR78329.1 hypothetical protein CU633_05835 [Bacillus sp. V3-13]